MIPRIIHYVWVGNKEKPKSVLSNIKNWKKKLKGYKFQEWNDDNFDFSQNKFLKQAYEHKKWAFVSDYIRAYVIYNYGGIYFDSDIRVIKNLDNLLYNKAFVGFQDYNTPFTAVFGAEQHYPLVQKMLSYYDNLDRFDEEKINAYINTNIVSDIIINEYDCVPNNKEQLLKQGLHVFPNNYLCFPSFSSYTIHIFEGSWVNNKVNNKKSICKTVIRRNLSNSLQTGIYDVVMACYSLIKLKKYYRKI